MQAGRLAKGQQEQRHNRSDDNAEGKCRSTVGIVRVECRSS
jgi:hypothetical protein